MKYFILFVLGVIFIGISCLVAEKKKKTDVVMRAKGVVVKEIQDENAHIIYHVQINDNGRYVVGESIPYYTTHYKYHAGDEMNVTYHYSKVGRLSVRVEDSDLISCADIANRAATVLLIFGITLVLSFFILLFLT